MERAETSRSERLTLQGVKRLTKGMRIEVSGRRVRLTYSRPATAKALPCTKVVR